MKNVIIIANIEWGFLKQRHQYLAEGLSALGYNVVFVESSAKRNPKISDIPRIFSRVLRVLKNRDLKSVVNDGLGVSIITPLVLPSTSSLFNFVNDLVFTRKLVSKINSKLKFPHSVVLAYAPTHTTMSIIDIIKPDFVGYDCVSNFEAVPGMPKSVVSDEKKLIGRSDCVFVDCDFLYKKFEGVSSRILQIEPGVFADKFVLDKRVSKIQTACYFGLVSEKIDVDLLYALGSAGIRVTVIGEDRLGLDRDRIYKLKPPVSHDELPVELSNYDALILPYVDTDYSKGVIPAKFFECFATGLPIIATDRDNFRRYRDYLITGESSEAIAKNAFDYEDNDERRLKRISIAKSNDWSMKFQQFSSCFEGTYDC